MDKDYEQDWPGLEIEHLVMATKDFIVFIDKELDVDWKTTPTYDQKERPNPQRHNEVLNVAAQLECIPSDHHTRNVRLNFKRMIGEAIARSLEYDYANAEKMLSLAADYIRERNTEKSRYWHLSASGSTALVISSIGLIAWFQREQLISILGTNAFFLLLSSAAGAMGALLSVIMRLGNTALNPGAGKNLHYLEGSYRVVAGCISAFLLALCVRLELLIPIFSKVEQTQAAMLLAGLAAGASERWAPSLISKLELDRTNGGLKEIDQ